MQRSCRTKHHLLSRHEWCLILKCVCWKYWKLSFGEQFQTLNDEITRANEHYGHVQNLNWEHFPGWTNTFSLNSSLFLCMYSKPCVRMAFGPFLKLLLVTQRPWTAFHGRLPSFISFPLRVFATNYAWNMQMAVLCKTWKISRGDSWDEMGCCLFLQLLQN